MNNSQIRKLVYEMLNEEYVNIQRDSGDTQQWDVDFGTGDRILSGTKLDSTKLLFLPYVDKRTTSNPNLDKMLDYIAGHPAAPALLNILSSGDYGPGAILQDASGFNPAEPLSNSILDLRSTLNWPIIRRARGGGEGSGEYQIKALYAHDPNAPEPDVVLNNGDGYHIKAGRGNFAGFSQSPAGPATLTGKKLHKLISEKWAEHGFEGGGKSRQNVGVKSFSQIVDFLNDNEKQEIRKLIKQIKYETVSDHNAKGLIVLTSNASYFYPPNSDFQQFNITGVRPNGAVDMLVPRGSDLLEGRDKLKAIIKKLMQKNIRG